MEYQPPAIIMTKALSLNLLEESYGIARLAPTANIPLWVIGPGFMSLTRTNEELSVTCLEERIPATVQASRGWRALQLKGPFAFDETGIISAVTHPLSQAGVGVFVVSTYDGDHVLVKSDDLARSISALESAGHRVIEPHLNT